jgi:Fe-S-cluster-containing dehydrogenase component
MTISRRGFLGGLAAGTGVLLGKSGASAHEHFAGYAGRVGLLHDTTLCIGCRSCEAACSTVNHLPPPAVPLSDPSAFEKKRRTTDKQLTVVNRYVPAGGKKQAVYRKLQCMHCNEPCCASVCFVKAFTKTPEGPVLYNPDVCVGCRYCVMACPYSALGYEYDNPTSPRVMRCTMCYDRIKQNLQPACAEACPTGAITFGKREALIGVARERLRKQPGRYIDHVFGETEYGGTSWLVLAGVPFAALGLPEGAGTEPLPSLGSGFLSVVPLVVTIYPGLLLGFYAFSKRKERLSEAEQKAAVAEALARAEEETKKKLAAAAESAAKDKEKAIAQAVKRAIAEAEAARAAAPAGAGPGKEVQS